MSLVSEDPLESAIHQLSTHPRLLVVTDFDGTISDFTEDPEKALLDPLARTALRILSELPQTEVAVISGRSLSDLTGKFESLDRIRLVGSHGHEFDVNAIASLSSGDREALAEAEQLINSVVTDCPGARIESKPHGVVFHYRGVPSIPPETVDGLKRKLSMLGRGLVREGSKVLEYCIVMTHKGEALMHIQNQLSPTITVFIGDDVTDEAAFQCMGGQDVSIKVGSGTTHAKHRVASPKEAVQFLVKLAQLRSDWIGSSPDINIDDHLFLSDLRTCALVDKQGTIRWLCTPRIDGSPLFGSLVGGPGAGHFRISASGEGIQRYLGNTLISQIDFGSVSLTDFLDCGDGRTFQRAGRSDLVRLVEGTGKVSVEYAPKFDFGRVPTRLFEIENGLRIECGQQRLVLFSPGWSWHIVPESMHDIAVSERILHNERAFFILLMGTNSANQPLRSVTQMLEDTSRFWELWLATLKLPKIHTSLVARSALVLRGLSHGPTGAIAAAATTSLPEILGGVTSAMSDARYSAMTSSLLIDRKRC